MLLDEIKIKPSVIKRYQSGDYKITVSIRTDYIMISIYKENKRVCIFKIDKDKLRIHT